MSYKQMPRLGSAIASTILSVFWAVSLVGVDKAQAAVLTYNIGGSNSLSFLKVDTSSLTGKAQEYIPVSEGRFYGSLLAGGKEYYNLAGVAALFIQGEFSGLQTSGGDNVISELIIPPDGPFGPFYIKWDRSISWFITTYPTLFPKLESVYDSYYEQYTTYNGNSPVRTDKSYSTNIPVYYTLVDTQPVPEPLSAGGTALALAGLSWLKHKKKMAA